MIDNSNEKLPLVAKESRLSRWFKPTSIFFCGTAAMTLFTGANNAIGNYFSAHLESSLEAFRNGAVGGILPSAFYVAATQYICDKLDRHEIDKEDAIRLATYFLHFGIISAGAALGNVFFNDNQQTGEAVYTTLFSALAVEFVAGVSATVGSACRAACRN